MTYDDQNLRRIQTLNPVMQEKVSELLLRLEKAGDNVLIYSAKRTPQEQEDLFSRGRTKPGKIVTFERDSNSYHVHGVAIDLVPIGGLGSAQWNDERRYAGIAMIAKELGFEWGYALWGFDRAHFHFRQNLTIGDFKGGKKLTAEQPFSLMTELGRQMRERSDKRRLARLAGPIKEMLARRIERRMQREAY